MGERLNQSAIFRVTRDFGLNLSQTSSNTIKPGNPESWITEVINSNCFLYICIQRQMFDRFSLSHDLWNIRGSNAGLDHEVPRPRSLVISPGNLVVLQNTGIFVLIYTSKTIKTKQEKASRITRGKTTRYALLWVKMC